MHIAMPSLHPVYFHVTCKVSQQHVSCNVCRLNQYCCNNNYNNIYHSTTLSYTDCVAQCNLPVTHLLCACCSGFSFIWEVDFKCNVRVRDIQKRITATWWSQL